MNDIIYGNGVDIIEVSRIKNAINKWNDGFLTRIFTAAELRQAEKRALIYEHLAGRFAAKEAVFKAFSDESLLWHDIEIMNDPKGKPFCNIVNDKFAAFDVEISISHIKEYAVASAIVTKKPRKP